MKQVVETSRWSESRGSWNAGFWSLDGAHESLWKGFIHIYYESTHSDTCLYPPATCHGFRQLKSTGHLITAKCASFLSMCVPFSLPPCLHIHATISWWHSLQQLSEEHGVGTVILISDEDRRTKTHTLSLWIDGASTHMVQTCCSCCCLVRNQRWSIFRFVMEINPYVHRRMSILLWLQGSLYFDAQWNYRKVADVSNTNVFEKALGKHSEISIQLDWTGPGYVLFFFSNFPRRL